MPPTLTYTRPLSPFQAEETIKDRLMSASNGHMTHEGATERVSKAMPAALDDQGLVAWMDKNGAAVEALVAATKKEFAVAAVRPCLSVCLLSDCLSDYPDFLPSPSLVVLICVPLSSRTSLAHALSYEGRYLLYTS